jgi:hypothetical protein
VNRPRPLATWWFRNRGVFGQQGLRAAFLYKFNTVDDFPDGLTGRSAQQVNPQVLCFITGVFQMFNRLTQFFIFNFSAGLPLPSKSDVSKPKRMS